MKKWTDIIDCYFSKDLASAYRPEWSTGKSLRHARAYQCYYCSSYYIQKARYQKYIEKCSGIPGVVYNFTNQNLVSFEDKIGSKGNLPPVAYMDFETTAPAEIFLTPEQKKNLCCFIYLNICFSSKTKLKSRHYTKNFWSLIIKISDGRLPYRRPAKIC